MSAEIWLCQLVAFVVMVLLLHIGRHLSSGKRPLALDRRTFTSIRTFVFQLYGLFFKQSIRAIFNETLHSNRILIAFWMLLGLVLSNVFSSIFYAILTVPEYEKAIDSVDDLLEAARTDSRFILTHDKSAMLRLIVNATANDAIDFELKQHLERVQQKMVVTMMEYIPTVEADRRNVLISLKLSIQAYRYLYATMPLHIGSETLGWAYMSWVLPKRSPLMAHFNEV